MLPPSSLAGSLGPDAAADDFFPLLPFFRLEEPPLVDSTEPRAAASASRWPSGTEFARFAPLLLSGAWFPSPCDDASCGGITPLRALGKPASSII